MDKEIKKKTVLGYLPDTWHVKTIEQIAEVDKSSLSASTPKEYVFDYISLSDVDGEQQEITTTKQIFKSAPSRARRIIKKGDVLMSTVRPSLQGFLHVRTEVQNLIASTGFSVLSPLNNDGEYIYQYLFSKSISKQLYALIVGSNYPAINSSDVRGLKIAYPPAIERKLISEILSTWDKAINKTQQLITQLQQRNKGLMQELLTGKRRLKGFKKPWRSLLLGQIFIERNEVNFLDLTLLSVGSSGIYPQSESEKRDTSNNDKSKYKRICIGDIGYNTMRLWQGRCALSSLEGIISPAYTVITPRNNEDAAFYSYMFKLPKMMHLFFRNSQGLVDDTLNCKFKDFKKIKILTPEFDEQKAIRVVIEKAVEEELKLKNQLSQLTSQKKGLLQKLLTGEIRIKNINQFA